MTPCLQMSSAPHPLIQCLPQNSCFICSPYTDMLAWPYMTRCYPVPLTQTLHPALFWLGWTIELPAPQDPDFWRLAPNNNNSNNKNNISFLIKR